MTHDEAAMVQGMAKELMEREAPLTLVLRPITSIQIAGLLQLAMRHPGISPDLQRTGQTVLEHVRAFFADCPTVLEVLRRGDDPAHDVPWFGQ
jgi:hypothetical protein